MVKNKKILIISIVAVILLGGAVAYSMLGSENTQEPPASNQADTSQQDASTDTEEEPEIDYSEPDDQEKATGSDIKRETIENSDDVSPEDGNGDAKRTVGIEVTSVSQEGKTVRVRTLIQTVEQNAKCTATLSKSGQESIRLSADTQALSSSSTCKGFDFDMNGKASGEWQLRIDYASERSVGSHSETITVK